MATGGILNYYDSMRKQESNMEQRRAGVEESNEPDVAEWSQDASGLGAPESRCLPDLDLLPHIRTPACCSTRLEGRAVGGTGIKCRPPYQPFHRRSRRKSVRNGAAREPEEGRA